MSRHRLSVLAVMSVVTVAVALRMGHLWWSPYPATLDGFRYAAQARAVVASGEIPFAMFRADNFVFANTLGMSSLVTGIVPLHLAQPWIAVIGAIPCLAGMAVSRRLAAGIVSSPRMVRSATLLTGYALAIEGLYLRRTSLPDEEAIGLLLLPIAAFGLYRWMRTERRAWGIATLVILLAFPLTHTFTTFITGMTLLGVVVAGARTVSTRRLLAGTTAVAAFWGYYITYYTLAEQTALTVPYVGRVTAHPGLFIAWVIVFVIGTWLVSGREKWTSRGVLLSPILIGFGVLLLNAVQPIFPGTVRSPPLIAGGVVLLLGPVLLAGYIFPKVGADRSTGPIVIGLIGAPIVQTYFGLTAALTPEFFGTVMRTQTFAHFPVLCMAGIGAAALCDRWGGTTERTSSLASVVVGGLLVVAVVTAPLAYIDLGTVAVPGTTTTPEFATAEFAAANINGTAATDFNLDRVTAHYLRGQTTISPTLQWLQGGPPPSCPVLANTEWTTTGGNFFPAGPETISEERFQTWVMRHNRIYVVDGTQDLTVIQPGPQMSTRRGC